MDEDRLRLDAIYRGWNKYQVLLIAALAPLTSEQLSLRSAPHLRSIEEIATHMIGARGRWFSPPLGRGDEQFEAFSHWDRKNEPERSAAEIINGLHYTFQYIQDTMEHWTEEDWNSPLPGKYPTEPRQITRQWVIWHLIEHDLHHGGEISLTLGIHQLKAPEL